MASSGTESKSSRSLSFSPVSWSSYTPTTACAAAKAAYAGADACARSMEPTTAGDTGSRHFKNTGVSAYTMSPSHIKRSGRSRAISGQKSCGESCLLHEPKASVVLPLAPIPRRPAADGCRAHAREDSSAADASSNSCGRRGIARDAPRRRTRSR